MRKASLIFSTLLLLFAAPLIAQENNGAQPAAKGTNEPAHFYRLQFVVQEVNEQGKPTNSRTFTTTVSTDPQESGRIRTGSRIPMISGNPVSNTEQSPANQSWTYMNASVNIDVQRVKDLGHQLSLYIRAQVDSIVAPTSEGRYPVTRQNSWESSVIIPAGKPTVVFSSDTLESKGSMQVVVTATPLP